MMPELICDGMVVAGDAAAMCLAAGIWLEGVNFAIGSGIAAGQAAVEALRLDDTTARGPRRLPPPASRTTSCSPTTASSRGVPDLILSDRGAAAATRSSLANVVERHLHRRRTRVPKPGFNRIVRDELKRAGRQAPRPRQGRVAGTAGASDEARLRSPASTSTPATTASRSRTGWTTSTSGSHERAHITVDGDTCRGCTTQALRGRLPGQPVRADVRRRHPLQLRAVLRVRHLLPRVQHRGRHHLDVPRGRPRRRLPAELRSPPCASPRA